MSNPPKKRNRALPLLIVLGLAGACIPCTGVLAAVAIPSFIGYVRRSKTSEAHANLAVLARGVVAAYENEQLQPDGTVARRLPPALSATPGMPGPERQAWPPSADPGWAALGFAPPPVYYAYEYAPDLDGRGFVVRAHGDLDGDGVRSLFEIRGTIDPAADELVLAPIAMTNELE